MEQKARRRGQTRKKPRFKPFGSCRCQNFNFNLLLYNCVRRRRICFFKRLSPAVDGISRISPGRYHHPPVTVGGESPLTVFVHTAFFARTAFSGPQLRSSRRPPIEILSSTVSNAFF